MNTSMIGVNRVVIDDGNTQEVYDEEDVRIGNDVITTQRGAYRFTEKVPLSGGSVKYVVSAEMNGGKRRSKKSCHFDLGKLPDTDKGILNFMTFKP